MTADLLAPTEKDDEAKRDRYGRYLISPEDGGKAKGYTRATTIAKALDDTYNLEQWKLRTAARGLATRPDLIARIATTDDTDKTGLNRLCDDALAAGQANHGANIGTALHAATETIDRGGKITLPEPLDKDLDIYVKTMHEAGIIIPERWIEKTVVNDKYEIAGTFDRIVKLPTGELVIADLKTGQDLSWSWPSIAVQLAIYANADAIYNHKFGYRTPLPEELDKTIGLVIHLPAGQAQCTLHTIDLVEGWRALQLALEVRTWRKHRHLAHEYRPDRNSPAPVLREELIARVQRARAERPEALTTLAALWPAGVPTFKASTAHTVAELEQIAVAIDQTEQTHEIPF